MSEQEQQTDAEGLYVPGIIAGRLQDLAVLGGLAAVSIGRVPAFYEGLNLRDQLPEPVDVFDHIGNLTTTYGIVALAALTIGGKDIRLMSPGQEALKRKRLAIAAAVIAVAANVWGETIGYGLSNTPDVIDALYGGVGGGYLAYKFTKPDFLDPSTVEIIETADFEDGSWHPKERKIALVYRAKIKELREKHLPKETPKPQQRAQKQQASSPEKHLKNKRRRQQQKRKARRH